MADTQTPPTPAIYTDPADSTVAIAPPVASKGPGKYRVKVIRPKCIGAGSCVAIAPKVFGLDDKQLAYVISEDELDEIKLLGAQSCPTAAIIVEDIETGAQVWPM